MIGKRRLLAATAGLLVAGSARAQPKYPSEPVKLVVPRAPGGGSDILARLLQPALEKKLGVPVIVDNRPDAAAVMGATIVTKAKPDGYTLLLTDNSFYQNPAILNSLPYDTLNGFTAITMLAQAPVILIVHPDVPAKTLAELLALAKKTNLTFASGGVGSSTHLLGVMVNLKAGTTITHVPFKSSGQALIALLGGHVSMQYGGLASAPPYIKDGKVRAIAITGEKRDPAVPDVPTFQESGLRASTSRASGACMPRRAHQSRSAAPARRDRRGDARPGDRQAARRPRLSDHRRHAGGAPGADQRAGQPMDRDRQEGEPERVVSPPSQDRWRGGTSSSPPRACCSRRAPSG